MNIRPYSDALRGHELDWKLACDSKAGGGRTVIFEATDGLREIGIQLHDDGGHRCSHMYCGQGTTRPTDFFDVNGMLAAIETERVRTDHSPIHNASIAMHEGMRSYVRHLRAEPRCRRVGVDDLKGMAMLALRRAVEAEDAVQHR